nr:trehalase family glycosidase [Legionella lansingensis]
MINLLYTLVNAPAFTKSGKQISEVSLYIAKSWDVLTRNNDDLLTSQLDTKLAVRKLIIYVAKDEEISALKAAIIKKLSTDNAQLLEFHYLPDDINLIQQHGLLYLPHPYVVPGGRFNEMYGWDSFFIELGLLENNRLILARNMIDNLLYEIDHYGTILNANRTYYLQRSSPPLLTQMILAYYYKTLDKEWLKTTLPGINKLYQYWVSPPHLIPELHLSRYYAKGEGPCPEESTEYYSKVLAYFKTHHVKDYDKSLYYNENTNQLTKLFYRADRSLRESGLDITAKYGPFGAAILDYAPVDLNVLLYKMEEDTHEIYQILKEPAVAEIWAKRAKERAQRINRYLWDKDMGFYFDYNFKTKRLRRYIYATTFYPLWAGIASKEQAKAVVSNTPRLLGKGGLLTSTNNLGFQWDAPFGWAPLQYFAVYGLERYGYRELAVDVANRFINSVDEGYKKTHTIFEKYDVETLSTRTTNKIKFSYATNETGFGWTNGVYLDFVNFINQNH